MHLNLFQRTMASALLVLASGRLEAQVRSEYESKAKFISILLGYVTWPPRGHDPSAPTTLVVLGISPFEQHLDQAVTRMAGRRAIRLVKARSLSTSLLAETDAIFICPSEAERIEDIIRVCRTRPILLLGDTPDFCRQGVMVNLIIQEGRIRSEVNLQAARQARIEIGSAFLAAAKPRIIDAH